MAHVDIVIGAQWGDEGKGKWVDILARDADVIVRYQGGNNAGHTLYVGGEKIVLHQIPSGVFQSGKACALAAGVVVNPVELLTEMEVVGRSAELNPTRLWLSARAHVISPWHIFLDSRREDQHTVVIGTTRRGIGPTYSEKTSRSGLRLGHYVDDETRKTWLEQMKNYDPAFRDFWAQNKVLWEKFEVAASGIKPFVMDAESMIRANLRSGKNFLLEGAQGALLDIDHGTYPFVTSSSTTSGGALQSLGISPKSVRHIIGISKAYSTRVGSGPMPTELKDAAGKHLAEKGVEFGATTGRPRRCGWLDVFALKYAIAINGLTKLVINKLDVLSGLDELKIATGYLHPRHGRLADFPWCPKVLGECKPVYETLSGWRDPLPNPTTWQNFPDQARDYIHGIQSHLDCDIAMIGTGVNREDAVFLSYS